ncbi:MAG TPA: ATP-dependent Clp protease proteolytic subunit [Longimicrobiales bacterium]|nr:ATP-dependent Clp protease proteolytic subunit [Longimicrobiales bacterium]
MEQELDWAVLHHPMDPPGAPEEEEWEGEREPPRPNITAVTDRVREVLFRDRTLIISGEVTQKLAADVMGQLLAMSAQSDEPITVYINSQGGHVESGDTIHDMIRFVRAPVRMVGTGWVASAGALIYVAVPREQRYSLPNTRFLLHQPAGGARGTAADVEIEAREILKMRERLNRVFAERTGQTLERIQEDTRRNFWLSASEAKEYGLVGQVVASMKEVR